MFVITVRAVDLSSLLNNTKWDELRLAMNSLSESSPRWRTRDVETGHVSEWDGEWFYHFRAGGYDTIEWVEIEVTSTDQRRRVLNELRRINLPGRESEHGYLVFGYAPIGDAIDYL